MKGPKESTELVDVGVPGGPLKKGKYTESSHKGKWFLTYCPVCGEDLTKILHTSTHIAKHDPEDFGLSPLNKR
jgi:hypothetical protein